MIILPNEVDAFDRDGMVAVAERRMAASDTSFSVQVGSWFDGLLKRKEKLDQPFANSEWIYACVCAICDNFSTLPILLYGGTKKKPQLVESGPVRALFDAPCRNKPPEDFLYWNALWMMLKGEAFIAPLDIGGTTLPEPGMPASFDLIAPSAVTGPKRAKGQSNAWTIKQQDDKDLVLPINALVHPYFPNPYLFGRGLGPADVAMSAAEQAFQAGLWNAAFMRNNANPGGVYKSKKALNNENRELLAKKMEDRFGGAAKAGRNMVLGEGEDFVWNPSTHRDMEFLGGQAWARDMIAAIFRVPKSVISVTDAINYATKLSDDRVFWERCVLPLARRVASFYNLWLALIGEKVWIAFDHSHVHALDANADEKASAAKEFVAMGVPFADVNERLGLGFKADQPWLKEAWGTQDRVPFAQLMPLAVSDGAPSPVPVHNDGMNGTQIAAVQALILSVAQGAIPPESGIAMLLAMFPSMKIEQAKAMVDPAGATAVTKAADAKQAAATASAFADPTKPNTTPVAGRAAGVVSSPSPTVARASRSAIRVASSREDARASRISFRDRFVLPHEKKVTRVAMQFFRSCRADALHAFDSRAFTQADMDRITKLKAEWDARMRAMFHGPFNDTVSGVGQGTMGELGAVFDVDFNDPRWLSVVRDRLDKLTGVNDTTIERIRSAMTEVLTTGGSTAELRDAIDGVFDGNASRSLLVARTEVGAISSSTRNDVFADAGVEKIEWVTAGDDLVRDSHAEVDGEVIKLGDTFSNGLQYPHDESGDAGEVCNCRCDHVAAE